MLIRTGLSLLMVCKRYARLDLGDFVDTFLSTFLSPIEFLIKFLLELGFGPKAFAVKYNRRFF